MLIEHKQWFCNSFAYWIGGVGLAGWEISCSSEGQWQMHFPQPDTIHGTASSKIKRETVDSKQVVKTKLAEKYYSENH